MKKFKSGAFIIYKGIECYLISNEELKISTENKECLRFGFEPYPNGNSFFKFIKKNEIESAFYVRTKAKYKDFTFQVSLNEKLLNEGKVRLFLNNLDFEAYDYFGFNYRDDNANIVVELKDLDEIWEEREPLLDYPFTVDPVYYLKKKNNS